MQDWKAPIRRMLRILKRGVTFDNNIRITAKPLSISSPGDSVPPSPVQLALSSSIDGSLSPVVYPQSLLPPLQLRIPGPSAGTPTPSIYRTAQNTPLSEQSQLVELY
jgi:hypothetical protein